jgi:hypothetical protein
MNKDADTGAQCSATATVMAAEAWVAPHLLTLSRMSKRKAPFGSSGTVLLISSNRDTVNGLSHYFAESGVPAQASSSLNPSAELRNSVHAVVVFPDDFHDNEVRPYLSTVRARRPELAIVVITRATTFYETMMATDGKPLGAVVLPRPAFGWTILDLVRERLASG